MSPREQALSNIPEAKKWTGGAIGALNRVIGFSGKRSEIQNLREFKALQTHFHVTLGPPPGLLLRILRILPFVGQDPALEILIVIRSNYFSILGALSNNSIFLDSPAEGEGEDATAFVPMIRDGTIRITPRYLGVGPLNQVLVLVHEATHFLGDRFQDFAYRKRKGTEASDPTKYLDLPIEFAIFNADSYAYFALQMFKGINRILEREE